MQKQFSRDFYEKLYKAIMDKVDEVAYDDEADGYPDTFYVDGCEVDATVYYGFELHDESFDHAFGTWHDPYPYMEATCVNGIEEVTVRDEDTGEEVSGFSCDAFMAQFDEPTTLLSYHDPALGRYRHVRLNSGDKVAYCGKEATFIAYNSESGKLKVRTDSGERYTDRKNVRMIA